MFTTIMSYANKEFCFFFFLIITQFGSFYYTIVRIRTSSKLLKRSVNSRHPCWFFDFKESAFNISRSLIIVSRKIKRQLYQFRKFPLFRVPIMKGCLILSDNYSACFKITKWFLSLNVLKWWIILIDFLLWNQFCLSGVNPTWLWYVF